MKRNSASSSVKEGQKGEADEDNGGSSVSESVKFEGRNVDCVVVPKSNWIGIKTRFPFGLFDKLVPADTDKQLLTADKKEVVAFYKCRWNSCDYAYVFKEGQNESVEVRNKICQHLEAGNGHLAAFKGKSADEEDSTGQDSPDTIERAYGMVRAVLRSGRPFFSLTEKGSPLYDFFRSEGASMVSRKTFVKYAIKMTESALDGIAEAIRRQFVFITMDSTAAKDTRNFITSRICYITSSGEYHETHFGVIEADGIISGDDYLAHLRTRAAAFDLDMFSWEASRDLDVEVPWPQDASVSLSERGILIGGASDMGPGALQAFRSAFGAEATSTDALHGVNNILKSTLTTSSKVEAALIHSKDLCKEIRASSKMRADLMALGRDESGKALVTIPPKFRKIRWGAISVIFSWVSSHWEKIANVASITKSKSFTRVKNKLKLINSAMRLLSLVQRSTNFLQELGPCDAIAIPLHIFNLIKRLREEGSNPNGAAQVNALHNDVEPMKKLLLARLHRRFFNGLLTIPSSYGPDRTRKLSLLDNVFVGSAFALLPCFDFKFMQHTGLVTGETAFKLRLDCENDLLRLRRSIDPDYFASSETGPDKQTGDLSFDFDDSLSDKIKTHSNERDAFRNSAEVRRAFKAFVSEMHDDPKGARQKFLYALFECGKPWYWIQRSLRVIMACPLSTVECERDFSWLQDLLVDKRLNMRSALVAAYLLGKRAPQYMKVSKSILAKEKSKRTQLKTPADNHVMTEFFKSTSRKRVLNKDLPAKKVINLEQGADHRDDEEVQAMDEVANEVAVGNNSQSAVGRTEEPGGPAPNRNARRSSRAPRPADRAAAYFSSLRGSVASAHQIRRDAKRTEYESSEASEDETPILGHQDRDSSDDEGSSASGDVHMPGTTTTRRFDTLSDDSESSVCSSSDDSASSSEDEHSDGEERDVC